MLTSYHTVFKVTNSSGDDCAAAAAAAVTVRASLLILFRFFKMHSRHQDFAYVVYAFSLFVCS